MSSQQPNSSQGNLPENTDCYYYYYSNCTKRDTCPYRHEPLALNQEKVCTFWLQGTCAKPHCMFRYVLGSRLLFVTFGFYVLILKNSFDEAIVCENR